MLPVRWRCVGLKIYAYVENDPVSLTDPLGLWTYSQSTGNIYDNNGNLVGNGYSGNGAGLNNPNMQSVPNTGPIPQGQYDIGPGHYSPHTGPNTMNLTPMPGSNTYGRDLFRMHGGDRPERGGAHAARRYGRQAHRSAIA
jgi:hypothetical protein